MVFGYHFPWDLALWTQGYASMVALEGSQTTDKNGSVAADSDIVPAPRSKSLLSILFAARKISPLSWLYAKRDLIVHSFNPILGAMLIGMIVGLTPPLRLLFFGPDAILMPIGAGVKRIGSVVPVLALQILSGTLGIASRQLWEEFWLPSKDKDLGANGHLHQVQSSGATWLIILVASKLILMPTIGFCLFMVFNLMCLYSKPDLAPTGVASSEAFGLEILPALGRMLFPTDQLLRTILVLQWSSPSCLTLIVLCHRVGLDAKLAQIVAASYLVMYLATAVSTTCWVAAGLALF
jgi:hypothetical protein